MVIKAPNPWDVKSAKFDDIIEGFADFPPNYCVSELASLALENAMNEEESS